MASDGVKAVVIIGAVSEVLCHMLGYIYPAYQTFKAIRVDELSGYKQWVTFWIVHSYFTVFEVFAGTALNDQLPWYYPVKAFILVWLVFPQFMGASMIYERFIAPFMLRYEDGIDRKVERVQRKGGEALGELAGAGLRTGTDFVKRGMTQVVQELKHDPKLLMRMLEEKEEEPGLGAAGAGGGSMNRRSTRRAAGEEPPRDGMDALQLGIAQVVKGVQNEVLKDPTVLVRMLEGLDGAAQGSNTLNRRSTERRQQPREASTLTRGAAAPSPQKEVTRRPTPPRIAKKQKPKSKPKPKARVKEDKSRKKGKKTPKFKPVPPKELFDVTKLVQAASESFDLSDGGYESIGSDLEEFLQEELE